MVSQTLQDYHALRASLIEEDYSLRRDRSSPLDSDLRDLEKQADEIIRRIRHIEAIQVWTSDYESVPHPFPGMEFLTGRDIIVKTRLFQILSKMPKGALLHAHLDATVNASFLLELAASHPEVHIAIPSPLTKSNLRSILPTFRAFPKGIISQTLDLGDSNYLPGSWIPLAKARLHYSPALGGTEGFDKWALSTITIDPSEAYGTHNTVEKIWQKFISTFIVSQGLTRYMPIFEKYVKEFFLSSIQDGISHVEPRISFYAKEMFGTGGEENVTHKDLVLVFDRVLEDVKRESGALFSAKIIYSTLRLITTEELEWYLEDCLALKKEFPHLIAGFDLVGDENQLKPLIYYVDPLLRFRARVQAEGIDLPFIFHAGETLGDGTEADHNLYDAILLGTKRIGHGFSIIKHPKVMELCRERNIAIEVCPISNEILRLTSSMPMHPLPVILNRGIPVALCSDDPSVFGNMGLSFDFYQVFVSSEVTGLNTLRTFARDSIEFSSLGGEDRSRLMTSWQTRWKAFLLHIIELGDTLSQ